MKHDFFRPGMNAESLISSIAHAVSVRLPHANPGASACISKMGRMSHLAFRTSLHLGFDMGKYMLSQETADKMCNVYSFPKICAFLETLGGARFIPGNEGVPLTNEATIRALHHFNAKGVNPSVKEVANYMNKFATEHPDRIGKRPFGAGDTQASSSLRALEGLGIVRQSRNWHITNQEAFAYLYAAMCEGVTHDTPFLGETQEAPQEAPEEAPESPHEGLVIEGECEEAPAPLLGLPAPEAPAKRPRKGRGK